MHGRMTLRVFIFILLGPAIGCVPRDRVERRKPYPFDQPTEPLASVVAHINQNNNRIKTIWASGEFDGYVRAQQKDGTSRREPISGEKLFLAYRKPGELKMAGEKGLVGRLFEIGSNREQFWMWIPFEKIDTMWWGEHANAASLNSKAIPVRPDLLTQVLGIEDVNSDLLKDPIPVMRFNDDEHAYMIVFSTITTDRMIAQKEVWYDVHTYLPRLVNFFDPDGRIVLRAYLSSHKPINDAPDAPKMATVFDLYFLQTDTKLVLKLSQLKENNNGIPNDRTFRFPGEDAAAKTYKVDEGPRQ
jgi:hypothetical protein